jgi:hypothetical protein
MLEAEMPREILEDETDFLNYFERADLDKVIVDRLITLDDELHILHQDSYPRSKNKIKELKGKREYDLYNLLLLRAYDPGLGIKVKLIKDPDEKLHAFSQNRLVITAQDSTTQKSHDFVTYLGPLARTLPPSSSIDVLELIKNPDETDNQPISRYLERTFHEFKIAIDASAQSNKNGNDEKKRIATNIRNTILPNRIRNLINDKNILIDYDSEVEKFIFFIGDKTNKIFEIKYNRYTDDLIERSGGVNIPD